MKPNLILLDPNIIERTEPIPPIIWNIENGIVYQDLNCNWYDMAIEFLTENYFPYETLCNAVKLSSNSVAHEEMCARIRFLMKENCSMVAIDRQTEQIVGVVILKIMRADDYSWFVWWVYDGCTLNYYGIIYIGHFGNCLFRKKLKRLQKLCNFNVI